MKSKTLPARSRENTKRVRQSQSRSSPSIRPMSTHYQTANREWFPGLCTTCANEAACTFPRSADRPVLTCEEFEGIVEIKPHSMASPRFNERFSQANREWFPGLCMTCEKLDTCKYPKPEGGVFSCDEFE